jgi:hypothetical protein
MSRSPAIPPEEFLKPTFLDTKWERMVGNILSRERLLQDYLSARTSRALD